MKTRLISTDPGLSRGAVRSLSLLGITLLPLLLCGCEMLRSLVGEPVAIEGTTLRPTEFSWSEAKFDLDLGVRNNTGFSIPIQGIDYSLRLGDVQVFEDVQQPSTALDARSTTTITAPVTLRYADVASLVTNLAQGARTIPYAGEVALSVAPAGREMRHAIPLEGEIPIPTPPDIRVSDIEVGDLTLSGLEGSVTLDVSHEEQRFGRLADCFGSLELNGQRVADLRGVTQARDGQVTIPWAISGISAMTAARRVIEQGTMNFDLQGALVFDAPWGPVRVPLNQSFNDVD